uniref:Uncharacterized protein n=1 Tax=mine drainage metagenome TaxID=410659 RepID=E6PUA7_9ZZZZ
MSSVGGVTFAFTFTDMIHKKLHH